MELDTMGNTVTQRVDGLRELGQALSGLSKDVQGRIGRAGTAAMATAVRKHARERAPVGTEPHKVGKKGAVVQPGNLKRNIVARRVRKTALTHEYSVTWRSGGGPGKDAFYGRYLETGTVKMPAQPFVGPALDAGRGEAVEALKTRLAARIRKAGG